MSKSDRDVRLSVAMATYNGARFIEEQLRSIARQELLPYELVVSDDGSSDDTLSIVRTFAEAAPFRVRIIEKPDRLGFADNFLFAVAQCEGEFVALSDQDDVWLPTKLKKGVQRLVTDDSLLSMHQLTMTDETLAPRGAWNQGIDRDYVWPPLTLNPWSGWGNTMMFKRELALMIPRSERPRQPMEKRPLSHDTWLYILAAAMGRVSHIAEPLILYRQHGENVCGMSKLSLAERIANWTEVPLFTYKERAKLFNRLAEIFMALGTECHPLNASLALAAGECYRRRFEREVARLAIYTGSTRRVRWHAFLDLYGGRVGARGDEPLKIRSAVKDLGLGVTGWGRYALQ